MALVELKSGNKGPALFLVPGLGGSVDGLVDFGRQLDTAMPVYGIEDGAFRGSRNPDTRMEVIAPLYLAEIRLRQPAGPYFLGGHSFGGLVAFEIAQLLLRANEEVSRLILLDTPISEKYWPNSYYAKVLAGRLAERARTIATLPVRDKLGFILSQLRKLYDKFADPYALRQKQLDVHTGALIAFHNYCPSFYPGRVIYFRSEQPSEILRRLWRPCVGQLNVYPASGGHNSMLTPPHVDELAMDVSKHLCPSDLRSPSTEHLRIVADSAD